MRRWGLAALLTLLVGCASNYGKVYETAKLAIAGRSHKEPTAESVVNKPYYQLQAFSPDGQAVLILGGVEGDLQAWYGQNGTAVFLDHGQIVRTLGLPQNLDDTHWTSGNPFLAGLQGVDSTYEGVRVADWSPGYRYGVIEHVHFIQAGMEDVNILGTIHHLRRVDERVDSGESRFVALNHYWVDPADGFVWRSHQVIAPGLPLDLVQLRPYGKSTP